MAMSPQMMQMLAGLAASYAGNKYGGGASGAEDSANRQSGIEGDAVAQLYAMTQDGSLQNNPAIFSNQGGGHNINEVMGSIDFGQFRETDLLKSIAGLIDTGSFGGQQMQSNAASEAALAEQLAPLIQELLKSASTKKTTTITGPTEASQAAWNEPY